MKILKNLISKTSGYTVFIITLFYLFCISTDYNDGYISFSTFGTIFLFGFIISLSELIFEIKKIHIVLRWLIHYFTLLIAFFAVFTSSGNIITHIIEDVFILVIVFSIFYAVMFAFVYIFRLIYRKIDNKIDLAVSKKELSKSKDSTYKPLYERDE